MVCLGWETLDCGGTGMRAGARKLQGIYVITDETLVPGRTHADIVCAAVRGGTSIIQLRDKCAPDSHLMVVGKELRRVTSGSGVLFIVNDRVKVALACNADGLHVGQGDMSADQVRRLWLDGILGVSVATPEQAAAAEKAGADYLGVGPVFATSTKSDSRPPVGPEQVRLIRAASSLPIVAIGGINLDNIGEVALAGADAAAVISAVVCSDDMVAATQALVRAWGASCGPEPSNQYPEPDC